MSHAVLESVRRYVRRTPLIRVIRGVRQHVDFIQWSRSGKLGDPPPHLLKQRTVRFYAKRFGMDHLIETGTYLGDMVAAQKQTFRRIDSIELSPELADKARARFASSDHITILQGDSGEVLPKWIADLRGPCLFWLDGHFSGGITASASKVTPIVKELEAILTHPCSEHVVLIDDARLFDGTHDYPTLGEVDALMRRYRPNWTFEVKDDIIRMLAPR